MLFSFLEKQPSAHDGPRHAMCRVTTLNQTLNVFYPFALFGNIPFRATPLSWVLDRAAAFLSGRSRISFTVALNPIACA
jgi:hypothetical protein